MTDQPKATTPDDRAAIFGIYNAMPLRERSLRKAADIYWASKTEPPPPGTVPTAGDLHAIIAMNGETRRLVGLVPALPWTFDQDLDILDSSDGHCVAGGVRPEVADFITYLVNSQPWETITNLLGLIAAQSRAIDAQAEAQAAQAQTMQIQSQLLHSTRLTADEQAEEIARQAALLAECDARIAEAEARHGDTILHNTWLRERLASHERRCRQVADARAWMTRYGELLGDPPAAELRQILEGGDGST